MNKKVLSTSIALGAGLLLSLAGCKDTTPNASEINLDTASVQGSSFDEPVKPAEQASAPASVPVDQAVITAQADAAEPATQATSATVLATANDVPENIAAIPSITPAPSAPSAVETPVPAPVDTTVETAPLVADASGFVPVSFKVLSGFKYEEPIPVEGEKPEDVEKRRNKDQIPADVKALDGKKAIVEGWMVPMEISEDGSVKSFVLVKTQPQCCFGDMQAMNEWVDVIMNPGTNAEFNVDIPVKVYGQLEVGEKTQDGFVLSVYRMKADKVEL